MSTLVIVESPTKAKTITKFLGKGFKVESSFGHVRDLPKNKMGVDIESGTFEPEYIVSTDKKQQVTKLKKIAENCDKIIFATDEDREGEAISWHLANILKIKPEKAQRIVFHEITKHAIDEAIKNPRHIDQKLVNAQQARRILDRLVGYELSPLLWKKVARGLSAGRVQSVAVRLIVEREKEIKNFISEEYWTIEALLDKNNHQLTAKLQAISEKKIDKLDLKNKEQVDQILKELDGADYIIEKITSREIKRVPPPPFTTSSLQQTANNTFGFSSKQTMVLAQQLYEGVNIGEEGQTGLITYMRTDSLNLSEKFLNETTDFIKNTFGEKYNISKHRFYANKSKGAQEAHEAIRPADPKRTPESLANYLDHQQLKLYTLIWKRAVATQMSLALLQKTTIDIKAKNYNFRTTGQMINFDGWLKLYPENIKQEMLPELKIGEKLKFLNLSPTQHFTEPPARYSDATLVKIMEEYGIGRPSTYAPTIDTIENRNYVERDENKRLAPTPIAFLVNDLLMEHFTYIIDYNFTAQMEQDLDEIAEGKKDWQPIISTFYHPFHDQIENKLKTLIKSETTGQREIGIDPKTNKKIFGNIGRYGPYVQLGEKNVDEEIKYAKLKKNQSIENINLEESLHLLSLPKILGNDENGKEILIGIGRFGPYIKVEEKFYQLKKYDPYEINLEQALEVIKEDQEKKAMALIKEFPNSEIKIKNGRYGPYITDGKINAKIPKDTEPNSLTIEKCQELILAKVQSKPKRQRHFTK